MTSVELVKKLCKDRGIPISKLERDLGFSNGYIARLIKGSLPYDRACKIADYFNVPTVYILAGVEEDPLLGVFPASGADPDRIISDEEYALIKGYRRAPAVLQEAVFKMLDIDKKDSRVSAS